jgi:cytoskeletal protein CcmA (bactofilin family)
MALKSKDVDDEVKVSNELNFLGTGTFVEGTVETKGSLRIDGRVKGAVKTADTLTIGAKGEVYGEVQARMAIVGGKIDGNVNAEEKLVLEANSILIGNLKTKKLVIDDGAIFQGKSDMGAPKQAKKETSPLDFQPKGENRGEAGTSEKNE